LDEEGEITTKFERTEPKEWKRIGGTSVAKEMYPVQFTGENEYFSPNVNDDDFKSFLDANGDICFECVFEWLLPWFGENNEIDYFEFIAAQRNYIRLWILKPQQPVLAPEFDYYRPIHRSKARVAAFSLMV
jgi:hypothetical protein